MTVYVPGDEYRDLKCDACGRRDKQCPYCEREPKQPEWHQDQGGRSV